MPVDPTDHEDRALLRQEIHQIRTDVSLIRHHVTGNGDPSKGMIVRLDRLEQRNREEDRRREKLLWLYRTLAGGVLTSIGLSLFQLLTGR